MTADTSADDGGPTNHSDGPFPGGSQLGLLNIINQLALLVALLAVGLSNAGVITTESMAVVVGAMLLIYAVLLAIGLLAARRSAGTA